MYSYSEELFLVDYFIFDSVVGRFCDGRSVFERLSRYYFIDANREKELYATATAEEIGDVATLKDYKRYRRLRQYSEICKIRSIYTDYDDDLMSIKGKALDIATKCELAATSGSTKASVIANIVEKAYAGQVTALRLYGVLQCEGIFFKKSIRDGIKNLTRAARWNSIESILALLQYDKANFKTYTDMLYTLAKGMPYEDILEKAQSRYPIGKPMEIKECILLSKTFGRGQITPDVYFPVYANLLYSEIIPFKDKEKLLLSANKDTVNSYMDLPLKLTMRKFSYNDTAIAEFTQGNAANKSIARNVLNSDIRRFPTFKPLCVCSDSQYMRNYYAAAIENLFDGAHVARISVSDLTLLDFEPDSNNVFVRNCDEDKNNVFVISFVGDINEQTMKIACSFLQSDKRRKMHLARPNVEIDFGAVLPICLCDKANSQALSQYCDKVEIANPTKTEQPILLRELISEKEKQYGIKRLTVEDSVMGRLCAVSIDAAQSVLDVAIAANRSGDNALTLTVENTSEYIKKYETVRGFGYGGYKNEN